MPYFRSIVLTSLFVISVPAGAAFAQYDSSTMMPGMQMQGSASSSSSTAPMGLFQRRLAAGSQGADVMRLQQILAEHGLFTVAPTGYFGPVTAKGVAVLQKIYNLEQVGFVGPQTRGLLNSLDKRLTESAKNAVVPSDVGSSSGSSSAPQAGGIFSRILNVLGEAANSLLASVGAASATSTPDSGFTLSFTANTTSVSPGGSITLTWNSNTDFCIASGAWDGGLTASGSRNVVPASTDTYTITCGKHNNSSIITKSIGVSVIPVVTGPAPAPTLSFTSNATTVASGGSVTLTWASTGATSCTAHNNLSGISLATYGSKTITGLTSSQLYTIVCTGAGGTVNKSVSVTVAPSTAPTPVPAVPTLSFTSNVSKVASGGSVTLTWASTGATSCTAHNNLSGTLATSGSKTIGNITSSQRYTIICTGTGGTVDKSVSVSVYSPNPIPGPAPIPTLTFTSNVASVPSGGSVTLTWASTGATSCTAHNNLSGTLATSGSKTITNITKNQLYTIVCKGDGGSINKSVPVTVQSGVPSLTPSVVTSEGDSISVFWSGSHTGIYAANHPGVSVNGYAVGGSGLQGLEGTDRIQRVLSSKPKVFTVLIGANDLGGYGGTAAGWHAELLKYLNMVRPTGAKIIVGTLLPQCNRPTFNALRDQANALIRADVGKSIDGVIDFAADPAFNEASDGCNTTNFSDYVHPTAIGQKIMAEIYSKAVDGTPVSQTTPPTTALPTLTFAATTNTTIAPGGSVTVMWSSTGATSCTASGSWSGTRTTTGTNSFTNITSDRTYTLSCAGSGGTVTKSVSLSVTSNQLVGANPILSNFDDSIAYAPAPIPASAAPYPPGSPYNDVVGAFRFICGAGQLSYDDPIVYPGQPGASHLHQYYGNTAANAYSTYASLRQTGGSTCNTFGDESEAANRSAYWMPAMLDGKGNVVKPDLVSIYYKRRPASDPIVSDPTNPRYEGQAVPLPNGLKFTFGYDFLTNKAPTGSQWFDCTGPTAVSGTYSTIAQAAANCPVNPPGMQQNHLIWRIEAPNCWDGKNLDSANHRDHVAYATYGSWGYQKCDAAHPYVIPAFTLGAQYSVDSNLATSWHFSSDEMIPGALAGTTGHADFFMAWSPTVRDMWESGCINKLLNCSGGNMGDGFMLKGAAQPIYNINGMLTLPMWTNPNRLVPVPAKP